MLEKSKERAEMGRERERKKRWSQERASKMGRKHCTKKPRMQAKENERMAKIAPRENC